MKAPFVARRIREPDFAYATLEVAEMILNELITSARAARPRWIELGKSFASEIKTLLDRVRAGRETFGEPVVAAFLKAWCENIRWRPIALYGDGVEFALPPALVGKLQSASNVSSLSFYLADLREYSEARLGSNDHNLDYGLYVNVPAWIWLATNPGWTIAFERHLHMVVHHEMAHFRWIGGDIRNEYIAHARGAGSLIDETWPRDREGIAERLKADYSSAWQHPEIREMFETTKGGARLMRTWGWRRRQMLERMEASGGPLAWTSIGPPTPPCGPGERGTG